MTCSVIHFGSDHSFDAVNSLVQTGNLHLLASHKDMSLLSLEGLLHDTLSRAVDPFMPQRFASDEDRQKVFLTDLQRHDADVLILDFSYDFLPRNATSNTKETSEESSAAQGHTVPTDSIAFWHRWWHAIDLLRRWLQVHGWREKTIFIGYDWPERTDDGKRFPKARLDVLAQMNPLIRRAIQDFQTWCPAVCRPIPGAHRAHSFDTPNRLGISSSELLAQQIAHYIRAITSPDDAFLSTSQIVMPTGFTLSDTPKFQMMDTTGAYALSIHVTCTGGPETESNKALLQFSFPEFPALTKDDLGLNASSNPDIGFFIYIPTKPGKTDFSMCLPLPPGCTLCTVGIRGWRSHESLICETINIVPVRDANIQNSLDTTPEIRHQPDQSLDVPLIRQTVHGLLQNKPVSLPTGIAHWEQRIRDEILRLPEPSQQLQVLSAILHEHPCNLLILTHFWIARKNNRHQDACDAILAFQGNIANDDPSAPNHVLLKHLQRFSCFHLAIAKFIPAKIPSVFQTEGKRVCYVLHYSLPYTSNGYATRSHGVARGMQQAGLDVICLTRPGYPLDIKSFSDPLPDEDCIDGVHYRRLFHPVRNNNQPILEYCLPAAQVFEEQFRLLQPTCVMAASNSINALPALIAARRLGIRFVYEVRGFWEITRMSRDDNFGESASYDIMSMLEGLVANNADWVFTLTNPMIDRLVSLGVDADKISLLPNSCDVERFTPRPRDQVLAQRLQIPEDVSVIGYVGGFVDYEGLDDLAAACGILKCNGLGFRLLLVGNENASGTEQGPITTEIRRLAHLHHFEDWLIMPGRVPYDEVEQYYSLIDIAPFPRKPWPVCEIVSPLKPLEALAMGKAVIVSSVAALREIIIDHVTGLHFSKGNVTCLAEKLAALIGQETLRKEMAYAGKNWVIQERTWKHIGIEAMHHL